MALVIPYTLSDAPDAEPGVNGLGRGFGRRFRGITRIMQPAMGIAQPLLGKAGGGIFAKAMPFAMPSLMVGGTLLAVGGAAALIKQHQKRKRAKRQRPSAEPGSAAAVPAAAAPAMAYPTYQTSSGSAAPVVLDTTTTAQSNAEPVVLDTTPAPSTDAPTWARQQPSPSPYYAEAQPAAPAGDAGPVDLTVVATMPTSAPSMEVIVPGSAAEMTSAPANPEAGPVSFTDPGTPMPSATDQPELVAVPTDAVPADAVPADAEGQPTVGGLGDDGSRPGVPPWLVLAGIGLGAYFLLRRR